MNVPSLGRWLATLVVCGSLMGCTQTAVQFDRARQAAAPAGQGQAQTAPQGPAAGAVPEKGWCERVLTEDELSEVINRYPELSLEECREILTLLNTKAGYRVSEDIRKGRKIKVPNDFRAYKDWEPLPARLEGASGAFKYIVVTKDEYFLGWYEGGKLIGHAPACLGRDGEATVAGRYKVEEKDADHFSRSYSNDFGKPAWMPWALRIYGTVWIHAGDLSGARCSHGCVILPPDAAESLFRWADSRTIVLVVDTLADLDLALKRSSR